MIRNSTVDFLLFIQQKAEQSIEVRVYQNTVWLTQRAMAILLGCSVGNIACHLKNIYASNELQENQTSKNFSEVRLEGSPHVKRKINFYNLDAVIFVSYRINSLRATQFRQWATGILHTFSIQGYVLDKQRLENGQIFDDAYFDHLLDEICEIRTSERRFYQKITDIYATSCDYSKDAVQTKTFYAIVQDKLHYAIHGHTPAEVNVCRANHEKRYMGLTSNEMQNHNQFVTMYLDYAERQASKHIPMTMEDWAKRLDVFLQFNKEEILNEEGRVSAEIAKALAESEFEQYSTIQDCNYLNDFEKLLQDIKNDECNNIDKS